MSAWPAARRIAGLLRIPEPSGPADPRRVPPGPLRVELLGATVRYGARTALEIEQQKLVNAVDAIASGKASSPMAPMDRFNLVLGITCHAVYHAGQIQLVKRLLA